MLKYLRENMKIIMILVAIVFVASVFYGLGFSFSGNDGSSQEDSSGNIAQVNGRPINKLKFQEILSSIIKQSGKDQASIDPLQLMYMQTMALNQTIEFDLLKQQAEREVRTSASEVDEVLANSIRQGGFKSKAAFEQVLRTYRITLSQFRDQIRDDILVRKLSMKTQDSVRVLPEDLREVRVKHILISPSMLWAKTKGEKKINEGQADKMAKAKAEEVLSKIRSGGNFDKLAAEYSDDLSNSKKGGDLGYFSSGMMVPEFDKAAFSMKLGDVSDIVKTKFGYHILKLVDSRLRALPSGSKEKDLEKAVLEQKRQQAIYRLSSDLRAKAKIKILDPLLSAYSVGMQGRYQEAIAQYNSLLAKNPNNVYARLLLGNTYEFIGQTQLAMLEYQKILQSMPSQPEMYVFMAQFYMRMAGKDPQKSAEYKNTALANLRKASIIAGENKASHEALAKAFKSFGFLSDYWQEQQKIRQIENKDKLLKSILKKPAKESNLK